MTVLIRYSECMKMKSDSKKYFKLGFSITFSVLTLLHTPVVFAQSSKSTSARKPASVPCFEASQDRYRVKRTNNLSTILYNLDLRPLWCKTCSVPVGTRINSLANRDLIMPGQILVLPKKCQYDIPQLNISPKAKAKLEQLKLQAIQNGTWTGSIADLYEKAGITEKDTQTNSTAKSEAQKVQVLSKDGRQVASLDPFGASQLVTNSLIKLISFQRFGIEPYLNYFEITGQNETTAVKLVSNFGAGLKVYFQQYLDNSYEFIVYGSMHRASPQDNPTVGSVDNKSLLPISAGAAVNYLYNPDLTFSGGAALKEEIYFETLSSTQAALAKSLNKELTAGASYDLYETKKYNVVGALNTALLLPTGTPAGPSQLGTLYNLGVNGTYKMNWGRITGGFDYGTRSQKTETVNYTENFVNYKAGFYYLF